MSAAKGASHVRPRRGEEGRIEGKRRERKWASREKANFEIWETWDVHERRGRSCKGSRRRRTSERKKRQKRTTDYKR
eukprot:scaffold139_cov325-Pavlova_lutheri.AAC.48